MATASPAPGGQPPADSETSGFVACLSQEPGDVVEQYRATLAGRPIFIVVLQAPDTLAREAVAYDAATCDVVVDVTQ
jgi:hypothetical protein